MYIKYPVIVEGKYDKMRLSSVISGNIITTDGFGIYNKKEKTALIRRLAQSEKIIVLTDSDGAGFQIRSYISECVPKDRLIHLYIPKIKGKEKRKAEMSKAGLLGVEGIDCGRLAEILSPFSSEETVTDHGITKADFYLDGLCGRENSAKMRDALCEKLGLPDKMSANALLGAVNILCTYDGYKENLSQIEK